MKLSDERFQWWMIITAFGGLLYQALAYAGR